MLFEEDIFTYNALLRAAVEKNKEANDWKNENDVSNNGSNDFTTSSHRGQLPDALQLVDDILANSRLVPDRFTIDLALLPLVRKDRMADVIRPLNKYQSSSSELKTMSNTFAAFLVTMVKGG